MRLHEVDIKNFRKLKDCKIKFRDTTFLIGPNNAGKSSVFAALDYLHKTGDVALDDYSKTFIPETEDYRRETEIEIIAEYRNLPNDSETWLGFKGRVISHEEPLHGETNKKIVYKKVWSIEYAKPKVFLMEYPRTVSLRYAECRKVEDLIGDDFTEVFLREHFGESNLSKALTHASVKNLLTDLPNYWDTDTAQEPIWVENPGGIPGNVLSKLPKIVIIPAESCITQLTHPTGALFKTLGELFDTVRQGSDNYSQAQVFLTELAKELNPNDSETDFGRLITDLNSMTHSLFPESSIHLSASLDQPEKAIKPQFNIEMKSNVRTTVAYQGHGMIRATAFQLLRYVQGFVNRRTESPRATIFCFEEPEIYLHPAAANQMRDVLYELAGVNFQIVATTHSPFMINLGSEKSMSLTKFSFANDEFTICSSFNLERAFEELIEDEKQNLKMLLKTDDYISRMFFTKKCIFVEGDTEEVIIRETVKRLGVNDKSRFIGNCEVLRARGKPVLISIAKYMNALGMNYIIMHDRDANTPGAVIMNEPILAACGEHRRIMLEDCVEDVVGYAAPSTEKPFKAYKYIQENWPAEFSDLPERWRNIFIDLAAPYLNHLRQA
ncbi:ATP-dependent nuclease [Pseudomonas moraviensis]|uniref:Energy-coupling factor transporter ATP-binding protein EcfA2 n=1 Tax=Pseudomonas moraviensis TaxID=321662 RepID=A0A7Z0AWI0_9PSED|nr:AAA family ATPase [Pseudomonas moraviensis]NYH11495.1 energy-coupling factor transporter ATP-binding protein EcfA2 [Pseudomonas moraviensis]